MIKYQDSKTSLVSIIMPAFNCEKYVAEALESIISQTYTHWELLVADDGSTDKTRAIIDRYNDIRIKRYHSDQNLGLVEVWNKLLGLANGDFIAWQDADDVSMPNRLEILLTYMEAHPNVMLCGSSGIRYYDLTGESIRLTYPITDTEIRTEITQWRRFPFLGPSRIIRREVLREIGGFREFFHGLGGEDIDFVLRIVDEFSVANVSDVLYVYRYTRGSSSRKRATDKTYLKLYIQDIAFFLSDQRHRDDGKDGLMPDGNRAELDSLLEEMRKQYERDISVTYRRSALTKINNRDYAAALVDIGCALVSRPLVSANYALVARFVRSLSLAIVRAALHRLRSSSYVHLIF